MEKSYPGISDEFDPVLFLAATDWPLPVQLDTVNDSVVVELVDA